jgi:hypothetical protein
MMDMIEMLQCQKAGTGSVDRPQILLQEAKRLDLRVSDAEVAESIMKTCGFSEQWNFRQSPLSNAFLRSGPSHPGRV